MKELKALENELKNAKILYRSMLEKLYTQEITQEEHDKSLAEYLSLTSKVRLQRSKLKA